MKKIVLTLSLMLSMAGASFGAGLLQPTDGSLPPLEIQDHDVRVVLNNGFAVTEVDQVFHNPHDVDLEAIYTFPLPKDASLSELSLWIDGEEIVGEVVEKERARKVYQEEKKAGRETALAEKREYLAFDVFVSPVRAGGQTRVRLVYLQPLEIDSGVGRYVYPLEEGKIDEKVHEFWDLATTVHGRFSFDCTVRSSYPLDAVRAKGYDDVAVVMQVAPDTWTVGIDSELESSGPVNLDQDIVVYYRLAQDLPARVDLLPYRSGEGEGTFLLVITPGADLKPITEGVDWTVVLDLSGSMSSKIAVAADAVARGLHEMRPQDRFRVVVFANRARLLQDWTPVTPAAVEQIGGQLRALGTEGGTNLYGGFERGLQGLERDRTSAMILVSDGGANVGPTHKSAFLRVLHKQDVRIFTFVMGQGANQPLLAGLAEESGGFSMDVSNQDDLYGRILQAKEKLAREALHGVEVELDGAAVQDFAPDRLPSAYHGQQIVRFGRYRHGGEVTLRLRARISGEAREWESRITLPEQDETYPEIERLWALARIQDLQDKIDEEGEKNVLRREVVELGTEYSIVTDHTSMIVVRKEQFEEHGIERKNRDRVENERDAREIRMQEMARETRADRQQPMFGNRPAPHVGGGGGGGGGTGAAGPVFVGLLGALLGARTLLRGRSRK